ncbi:MAG: glycosyltransferase family 2 protein [Chitinophagales bacterium]
MNRKVSILMPVYNAAPFLVDCLNSIFSQDYVHWELVAVDDFSEDRSLEILKEAAKNEPRLRVLQNEEKGIIPALQLAYSNCNGVFITRMDADDLMPKRKLSLLLSALLVNGRGHVSTGYVKYFAELGVSKGYLTYENWLNKLCEKNSHFEEIYKECVIPSPCWMMYRDDFEQIGAFDSKIYPEDYELCFRMYASGLQVLSQKEICHLWRDHAKRSSRIDENYSDNRFLDLKITQFLAIDFRVQRSLVLWGAGKKGKLLAQKLIQEGIPFLWICNNKNKIGKEIYRQVMLDAATLNLESKQIIVAVASPEEKKEIQAKLEGHLAYYFC